MYLFHDEYAGFDVLDPTSGGAPTDDAGKRDVVTRRTPGLIFQDAHEDTSRYRRIILVQTYSLADLTTAIQSFMWKKGRLIPFWLPTWDYDFVLAANYTGGGASLQIEPVRYADKMWPASKGRRHIHVYSPLGSTFTRRVTVATWPGTGPEVLTLNESISENLPKGQRLSMLRFCRFDTDEAVATVFGVEGYAELQLPIIEVPQEAP